VWACSAAASIRSISPTALWQPAGQPWQKAGQALTDGVHRAAMVELLIAGEPGFLLDRIELDRQGPSYTIDTVRAVAAQQPGAQLFLVIGQDQYARLHSWHGWQELLQSVSLAVAARAGAAARFQARHGAAGDAGHEHLVQRGARERVARRGHPPLGGRRGGGVYCSPPPLSLTP
jgi:nicotinate (nicotinamide) nucleotide adenylyltransferase